MFDPIKYSDISAMTGKDYVVLDGNNFVLFF